MAKKIWGLAMNCKAYAAAGWAVVRLAGCLSLGTTISEASGTNEILRAHVEFIADATRINHEYVSGEPIWIIFSLTNNTDKPVSVKWDSSRGLPHRAVTVWLVREGQAERLQSPENSIKRTKPPKTTILPYGTLCFTSDVINIVRPSRCLSASPIAPLLYETGAYMLQLQFEFQLMGGTASEKIFAQSEKLSFYIKPMNREKAEAMLPKIGDKGLDEDAQLDIFALLLINLDGNPRNELLRKGLDNSEPWLRSIALKGCERYRVHEFIPKIQKMLDHDDGLDVAATAVSALAAIDPENSVPILLRVVEQRKNSCWQAAMHALARMRERRALPILRNLLNDSKLDDESKLFIQYDIKLIESK